MTKEPTIPAPRKPNSFNFAKKLEELESIVASLEADNDVDKAVAQFEHASKLAKELQDYLDTAENTVQTISKKFDTD